MLPLNIFGALNECLIQYLPTVYCRDILTRCCKYFVYKSIQSWHLLFSLLADSFDILSSFIPCIFFSLQSVPFFSRPLLSFLKMKYSTFALAAAAGTAVAQQSAYGQCVSRNLLDLCVFSRLTLNKGGQGWTGATTCVSGYHCAEQNQWYSQCIPGAASGTTKAASSTKATTLSTKIATSVATSKTTSQAVTKAPVVTSKTTSAAVSTRASTTKAATTTSASSSKGKVKYAGINISGFDFGMDTNGDSGTYVDPSTTGQNQMNHFVKDDKLNAFRIPVGWQYLVGSTLGGTLDSTFFAKYDAQITYCLNSGAELCIIDLHNYARWNGAVVGSSGGPTAAQFASVWSQLATKYVPKPPIVLLP